MTLWFDPDPSRKQVWSCGGGTQSTAIAALIILGRLPKPEISVFVNTERENSDVFPYFERWTQPALLAVGVVVDVVRKSRYATVDLTSKNGRHILLPAFTSQSGKPGKLPTYCSAEWKRDVMARHLRRHHKIEACDVWIGFSRDEANRVMTKAKYAWQRLLYPLFDLRMSRAACVRVVQELGWPPPPRSSCWMCPNKSDAEWREMKEQRPEDFAQAVSMERMLRRKDPHLWLHKSCKPLDQVEFATDESDPTLFGCDSGVCFV